VKTSRRTVDSIEKLLTLTETTESGCMVFTRKWQAVDGYGILSVGKKRWLAHRYAWSLVNGDIPANMCIMHTCDNPSCINPQHLRLGTFAENNQDREAKGRSAPVQLENHPRTKLTNEQVREIKRLQQLDKYLELDSQTFSLGLIEVRQ